MFADRLIQRLRKLGHPLCVGLDPQLDRIAPVFQRGSMRPGDPETAPAVEAFCLAMLDRLADRVAIVKPQIAFFEALGWQGLKVLSEVMAAARERGLLVLLDAKRGDIGSTAEGYAAAYLAKDAPLRADALTVNPYLGFDTLEPFVAAAEASGAGLFVLVKTSNPGSADLQDLLAGERPVFDRVAEGLVPFAARLRAPETEWSGLGAVVGATYPEHGRRIREILPRSLFLVPGYGAQGAGPGDAVAGFVPAPDGRLEGGIINSSRAILYPQGSHADAPGWERAVDAALDAAISDLTAAITPDR